MKSKIKVLHYVNNMNKCGGVQEMLINQYKAIDKDKVQYDFLIHSDDKGYWEEFLLENGSTIHRAELPVITKNIFKSIKSIIINYRQMKSILKLEEYDIIQIHLGAISSRAITSYIAKKNKIKNIIMHSHMAVETSGIYFRIMKNIIKKSSNWYFACSLAAGKSLYGENINLNNKFKLIKNTIDTEKFLYNEYTRLRLRRELGIEDKLVIGHIGRFNVQKNHDFLIDVFYKIQKRNSDAVLLLIGEGELEDKIKKKVNNLNLYDKVKFLGVRQDVNDILQVIDICIFPSLYEGLPVVLIEAQAAGVNIIASQNITQEVKVSNLINFLDLDDGCDAWANYTLYNLNRENRRSMHKLIKDSGYDTKTAIADYENIYREIYSTEEKKD